MATREHEESQINGTLNFDDDKTEIRGDSTRRRVLRACLVGDMQNNEQIIDILKNTFDVELLFSDDGAEYRDDDAVVFVVGDFASTEFRYLSGKRILGPTVILQADAGKRPLPFPRKHRPLYCQSMNSVVTVLCGFSPQQTKIIVDIIHYMGGSVRREVTAQLTHLVSATSQRPKYREAVALGCPVLDLEWVMDCWSRRHDPNCSALDPDYISQHKLKPFHGLRIALEGFEQQQQEDIASHAVQNGGTIVSLDECTHVVMADETATWPAARIGAKFVAKEWFWISVQLECCANETVYPCASSADASEQRKTRKRAAATSPENLTSYRPGRKTMSRTSVMENMENVSNNSLLSDHLFSSDDIEKLSLSPAPAVQQVVDKRRMVCQELLQTEINYVNVLQTVIKLFKEPLEELPVADRLLDAAEMSMIFGKIGPILEEHHKICKELTNRIQHYWSPERTVGDVWSKYALQLRKVYPPFINSFENIKEVLKKCDETKPRFHAFLKINEGKKECMRQRLDQLLIRPVQRLPSVILLLRDILNRTGDRHPDYQKLLQAEKDIDYVLKGINDEKRRTDDSLKLFEIKQQTTAFPDCLLSGQRTLIAEFEVYTIGGLGTVKNKGETVRFMRMYLFNDCLMLSKHGKATQSAPHFAHSCPEPANLLNVTIGTSVATGTSSMLRASTKSNKLARKPSIDRHFSTVKLQKSKLKYQCHFPLTQLLQIDIVETAEAEGVFALTVRDPSYDDVMWVLQMTPSAHDEAELRNFLELVAAQTNYLSSRDIRVTTMELDDEECRTSRCAGDLITLRKVIHKRALRPGGYAANSSFIQPAGIRRAFSNVQVGLSNTLSRMTASRVRLPAILDGGQGEGDHSPVFTRPALPMPPSNNNGNAFGTLSRRARQMFTRSQSTMRERPELVIGEQLRHGGTTDV